VDEAYLDANTGQAYVSCRLSTRMLSVLHVAATKELNDVQRRLTEARREGSLRDTLLRHEERVRETRNRVRHLLELGLGVEGQK
jgi:hypothetical protein